MSRSYKRCSSDLAAFGFTPRFTQTLAECPLGHLAASSRLDSTGPHGTRILDPCDEVRTTLLAEAQELQLGS